MLKRSCQPLALAILAAMSAPAGAVAVNDMAVWSSAGAPLRMDIGLTDLEGARLSDVNVRVASAADHERLGVSRPDWADQVRFKLIKTSEGKLVARATTASAVPGEFVSFLVYIRADGQSRLQQVAGKVAASSLAPAEVSADMVVAASAPKPRPTAKPKPKVEVAPVIAAEPAPAPVAAPAPTPAPAPVVVAPAAPAATAATAAVPAALPSVPEEMPAPGTDTLEAISQERAALQQGLQAAQAQVADIEARLKTLDEREAALNGGAAPAADATADATATDAAMPEEAAPAEPAAEQPSAFATLLVEHFNTVMALFMAAMFGIVAFIDRSRAKKGADSLPDDVSKAE